MENETNTTAAPPDNITQLPVTLESNSTTCPHCGYCPHCGRSNTPNHFPSWTYIPGQWPTVINGSGISETLTGGIAS